MRKFVWMVGLLAMGLLAACGSGEMVPPPDPTRSLDSSVQSPALPPGEATQTSARPFDPQPGDADLQRGNVYLDQSEVLLLESFPPQVAVHLVGNLPTPCHSLRVAVKEPDAENKIHLDVYSVVAGDVVCAEVLQPLDQTIVLGTYPAGQYSVLVNGTQIGEVALP
jgi:hypothetical protein